MFRAWGELSLVRGHLNVSMPTEAQTDASLRLRPEMASRRLLVLSFVRNYIDRWGQSPSYGEIANGCGISPTRARQLVKALVKTGHLLRTPGPRGLSLPTLRDDAVRQLRGLGWTVDERGSLAHAPCAETTLPGVPVLDYIPSEAVEEESGGKAEDA